MSILEFKQFNLGWEDNIMNKSIKKKHENLYYILILIYIYFFLNYRW
jgi:hypothetical protein